MDGVLLTTHPQSTMRLKCVCVCVVTKALRTASGVNCSQTTIEWTGREEAEGRVRIEMVSLFHNSS